MLELANRPERGKCRLYSIGNAGDVKCRNRLPVRMLFRLVLVDKMLALRRNQGSGTGPVLPESGTFSSQIKNVVSAGKDQRLATLHKHTQMEFFDLRDTEKSSADYCEIRHMSVTELLRQTRQASCRLSCLMDTQTFTKEI